MQLIRNNIKDKVCLFMQMGETNNRINLLAKKLNLHPVGRDNKCRNTIINLYLRENFDKALRKARDQKHWNK